MTNTLRGRFWSHYNFHILHLLSELSNFYFTLMYIAVINMGMPPIFQHPRFGNLARLFLCIWALCHIETDNICFNYKVLDSALPGNRWRTCIMDLFLHLISRLYNIGKNWKSSEINFCRVTHLSLGTGSSQRFRIQLRGTMLGWHMQDRRLLCLW